MKNLSIRNFYDWPIVPRALIVGLISALVFFGAYRWDISGLSEKLTDSRQKENDIKQQFELVISKQIAVENELAHFIQLQNLLSEWQKKLVTPANLAGVINEILKIGGANHLNFNLFNPMPEVAEGVYFKTPIRIVAVGSYHELATFMSQVANMPNIISIRNFVMTSGDKSNPAKPDQPALKQGLLTAEFNFEVYHLGKKKPAA